jgi:histidinol phosphatase-like enzyme
MDFLPVVIRDKKLIGINSRDYFRDVGTPERLTRGQSDYENGSFTRRSRRYAKALFIDRDGTVIPDIARGRSQIIESEIDSDLVQCIIRCNQLGVPVFMVTNQPAVAKGWLSENEVNFVHQEMEMILSNQGAFIDEISFCPHHPEKGFLNEIMELKFACRCRKPEVGQYEKIAQFFDICLEESIYIGDSQADEIAARRLNGKFFKWEVGQKTNPIELLEAEIEAL